MRGCHLNDVFQFVDDLIYYRVCSLHFDFRVGTLRSDSITNHTKCVAVKKGDMQVKFIYSTVCAKCISKRFTKRNEDN